VKTYPIIVLIEVDERSAGKQASDKLCSSSGTSVYLLPWL
jgi:hypothetical protein